MKVKVSMLRWQDGMDEPLAYPCAELLGSSWIQAVKRSQEIAVGSHYRRVSSSGNCPEIK